MKLYNGIIEMKPGWFVRLPYPMTAMEMSHYRFDPVTIGLLIMAAGTATVAIGQIQQGRAAEAQAKSEQDILEHNAKQAEKLAEEEREAARVEAEKFRREGEVLIGTQKVQLARGGVLTTEGTPALLLEETAQELESERFAILTQGFKRGEFRESQAFGLRFQGQAAIARGANIKRGAQLAAGATLLTGAGKIGLARQKLRTKT